MNAIWNTAIWKRTWGDQRGLVLAFAALWSAFPWIYLALSAEIPMKNFELLLGLIPKDWQRLSGVPLVEVATPAGRVALAFVDPMVVLAATVWGIARGSDAVSGQVDRGTLEMVLSAPVSRTAVFLTQALAVTSGAALLCGILLASTWTAVAWGPWAGTVDPARFVPAVANVFGLMVALAGLTAAVSAAGSQRWRSIGILCGFYVVSLLAKLAGRLSERFEWVGWFSILGAYEPQRLVDGTAASWETLAVYDGVLVGLGILAYAVGAVIFARRDLPAPL